MNTAVTCARCGAPLLNDDRYCGTCGAPRTPSPVGVVSPASSDHATKLLAQLKAATVGEYEIRGEIGRGGMAAVYLAYDLRLNRKVAVKVMLPELAYHEGMEERFKREARTAAKLDHPNIVVIYTVRDVGELLFFAMKFIDGVPLDTLIRSHTHLPLPVTRSLLLQLCHALQYAHDEGIIHRDVKPANVIVDNRGTVQVTDFGIAKATESPTLTRTGTAIGTPAYMSPEQCLGQSQSAASDQYSLGIVAYELIAGRPPFSGAAVEIQWAHVRETPVPLGDVRPDCPPELANAVMRMIAKQPSERWPSLRDVLPYLGSGVIDIEAARPALVDLVRVSTSKGPPAFAITPASPVPQRFDRAGNVIDAIVIDPPECRMEAGESRRLEARTRRGTTLGDMLADLTWNSSDDQVATVTSDGLLTGARPGAATISVRLGALAGDCAVTVEPARIVSIDVTPRRSRLEVGTTERMTCVMRDARDAIVSRIPTWSSSNPAVASVDEDGVVTAHSLGRVTVAAMVDALAATAGIEVQPDAVASVALEPAAMTLEQRTSVRFTVRVANARGQPIVGRPVTWASSNRSVASVDNDGRAVAVAEGRCSIGATVDGNAATADIVVTPASVASVEVRPAHATVTEGGTAAFTAIARDSLGVTLEGRTVTWQAAPRSIASVDDRGSVSTQREGTAFVTASVGGISASATLVIARAPLAEIALPRERSLRAGKRTRFRPTGRNTRGQSVAVDGQWTSSDPAVATVDGDGTVTAHREGSTTITISSGGCEARVSVRVMPPVAGLSPRMLVGSGAAALALGTALFMALRGGASTSGAVDSPAEQRVPPPVPVASRSPAAANSVPPPPAAKPVPADSAPLRRASPAPRDTSVAALRTVPDSPVLLEAGESTRVRVVATNRKGETLSTVRPQWRSADTSVATVSRDGEVSAVRAGQTVITARSGDRTSAFDVRVRDASAARIVVAIARDSLRIGEVTTATARAYDRRGTLVRGTAVWRSSNPAIATVDDGGRIRAVGAGRVALVVSLAGAGDSLHLMVLQPAAATTTTLTPSVEPPPTASRAVQPQQQPQQQQPVAAATPPSRAAESAPVASAKSPAESDLRAIADTVLQMIERRQVGRMAQAGTETAKARADLQRFFERNHPAARLTGTPVASPGARGTARVSLPLVIEWRTIGGRRERALSLDCAAEPVAGGWAIREIVFPAGFNP